MISARTVFEGGLRWRVGNGESFFIWGDKWLPSPSTFQVQSPVNLLAHDARVSALINPISRWWDVHLIRSVFHPEEAEVICGMLLSPLKQPDKLIWSETRKGYFTVKSAYHLELARCAQAKGECSMTQGISGVWKALWSLPLSGVLKHFAWKVL